MSDAAGVLDRLRLQQAKYREMVSIVSAQRSVFASLDVDGILGLIEQKRRLLEEIDAIEKELSPLKGDWARVRAGFSPEEGRALEETLDETKRVLEELVGLEDEGRALLERRHQEKSEALDGLLKKNRARGAYGAR
jgi:flagellar biosynthesis/type III secretory pathway chaperone